MTDKTNDLAQNRTRRWGLLRQLMERQEDVKDRLVEIRQDLSSVGGLQALSEGYDEDIVTAVVINRIEMRPPTYEGDRDEVQDIDLVWAVEFLDHLDTQGFRVERKPLKEWKLFDGQA